jgi:hypothetical protein
VGWVADLETTGGLDLGRVEPTLLPEYYRTTEEWPSLLHVSDCEVATGQIYCVQAIFDGAHPALEANYSPCLRLNTPAKWGDVIKACPGDVCTPPQGIACLDDIMAKIKLYQGIPVAPRTWLDDGPSHGSQSPNQVINLDDIQNSIRGFQGQPYPGDGPLDCP